MEMNSTPTRTQHTHMSAYAYYTRGKTKKGIVKHNSHIKYERTQLYEKYLHWRDRHNTPIKADYHSRCLELHLPLRHPILKISVSRAYCLLGQEYHKRQERQ